MNSDFQRAEQTISMSLQGEIGSITRELITYRVNSIPVAMGINLSEDEVELLIHRLEAAYQIQMDIGFTLVDTEHTPWVRNRSESIDWYYWTRYKQLLIQNGFGTNVVGTLDIITDDILDLLQNPDDEGKWGRKGLVVGHVQSGKTANYIGVVCKALDAGYKVVIILAGLLNSLRKQTQGRVYSGVIGLDSTLMLNDLPLEKKLVGVGNYSSESWPVAITTAHSDFNRQTATRQQTAINQYNQPLVFVVKKNVSILRNLIDWLKNNNFDLSEYPMLLIDDEADHASINTSKEDLDPTKTNDRIRELLSIFPKNIYLGYTATPFANIFINPDTSEDMINDLFPENFIKSLEPPSNYFGPNKFFVDNNLGTINEIDDFQDILPIKHKKDDIPDVIPDSLKEATRTFIIVGAIRILRSQENKHNSMLVNVSRFTGIQSAVRVLIHNHLSELRTAIRNHYALCPSDALMDSSMNELNETYSSVFPLCEFSWETLQSALNKAASRIEVIEVNSSKGAEKEIDYSARNYPEGRHIIAVGGLSLSRGITLEGLSTTYFLRNSIMYDTLLQMGRWFGYRPGYEDLCRIYMTKSAHGWYEYVTHATDELRNEFIKMEQLKKTPKDFGLCVRNHPKSLIVTARNKMRSARTVVREVDLTGRLIETTRLYTSPKKVRFNLDRTSELHDRLLKISDPRKVGDSQHLLWENVPYDIVSQFIESFQNHPESAATDSKAVKNYVEDLALTENILKWKVLFVSVKKDREIKIKIPHDNLDWIGPGIRRTTSPCTAGIMLSQRKLGSAGIEEIDLEDGQVREIPLLMLHILDCRFENNQDEPIFPNGVAAYGLSFPGEKAGRRIKKLATYQVNTTWMRQKYSDELENDEDLGEDIW